MFASCSLVQAGLASLFIGSAKALLLAAMVFVPLERVAGMRTDQRPWRHGFATDALTGLINAWLLYAALLMILGGINAIAAAALPRVRAWIEIQPLLAQTILAVILGDLGIYGFHRLAHVMPWLWRFHAVHHSAEEMDWLVAARFHPYDLLCTRVASLGPLVALNVAPAALAVLVVIFGWQSWLVHANVRVRYGPLRWVLVSPEFHHWHHSIEREAHNRNYASLFSVWDVLFGTAHLPLGRQPSGYGVEEPVPEGWLNRFFYPFTRNRHRPADGSGESLLLSRLD
jgi:sterol desaturase/sphingolipid hydroxylase (fatty acid hydroxylase superfamily)